MPYITVPIKRQWEQLNFDDLFDALLDGKVKQNPFEEYPKKDDPRNTRTVYRETTPQRLKNPLQINDMVNVLADFCRRHKDLIEIKDKSSLYRHFKIPKRSGGLRPIDAPNDELSMALTELKEIFERKFYASYHSSAFAYMKGRCPVNAVQRHKENGSRWFLKLDLHNFFGSTTQEFLLAQLEQVYPFSEILRSAFSKRYLVQALSLCFLNGGLPQGTPISPMLTNMMMIPIDFAIAKMAREHSPHFCYTRYADDMTISCRYSFKWTEVQQKIVEIFESFNAPFSLKKEKTHYGSSAGRNWMLGVMLNKEGEITIGHQRKKELKAMLFNFINDCNKGQAWSYEDVKEMQGKISYYKQIERESIDKIISDYSTKYRFDINGTIKRIISTGTAA